ncbi:hypothetical protein BT63DRAFT_465307 [Microthyrium microscopicum]|uniref:Uncharacterized protein n=1 Tax=Microthyrium microscopicum TaxID=703497 RepID=A0A6A6TUA5_9PEZI|nr:hypothetical protein BT63DRAFT_465307 [Microthyrium microscopicum]
MAEFDAINLEQLLAATRDGAVFEVDKETQALLEQTSFDEPPLEATPTQFDSESNDSVHLDQSPSTNPLDLSQAISPFPTPSDLSQARHRNFLSVPEPDDEPFLSFMAVSDTTPQHGTQREDSQQELIQSSPAISRTFLLSDSDSIHPTNSVATANDTSVVSLTAPDTSNKLSPEAASSDAPDFAYDGSGYMETVNRSTLPSGNAHHDPTVDLHDNDHRGIDDDVAVQHNQAGPDVVLSHYGDRPRQAADISTQGQDSLPADSVVHTHDRLQNVLPPSHTHSHYPAVPTHLGNRGPPLPTANHPGPLHNGHTVPPYPAPTAPPYPAPTVASNSIATMGSVPLLQAPSAGSASIQAPNSNANAQIANPPRAVLGFSRRGEVIYVPPPGVTPPNSRPARPPTANVFMPDAAALLGAEKVCGGNARRIEGKKEEDDRLEFFKSEKAMLEHLWVAHGIQPSDSHGRPLPKGHADRKNYLWLRTHCRTRTIRPGQIASLVAIPTNSQIHPLAAEERRLGRERERLAQLLKLQQAQQRQALARQQAMVRQQALAQQQQIQLQQHAQLLHDIQAQQQRVQTNQQQAQTVRYVQVQHWQYSQAFGQGGHPMGINLATNPSNHANMSSVQMQMQPGQWSSVQASQGQLPGSHVPQGHQISQGQRMLQGGMSRLPMQQAPTGGQMTQWRSMGQPSWLIQPSHTGNAQVNIVSGNSLRRKRERDQDKSVNGESDAQGLSMRGVKKSKIDH